MTELCKRQYLFDVITPTEIPQREVERLLQRMVVEGIQVLFQELDPEDIYNTDEINVLFQPITIGWQ